MHCPHCGTDLASDAVFCSKCGSKVAQEPKPAAANPQLTPVQLLVFVALMVGGIWFFVARDSASRRVLEGDTPLVQPNAAPASSRPRVTYRVFGAGTNVASLTYENAQGGTEQRNDQGISPAWELEFTADSGQFVYLSAQNANDSGSVTCEIRVDGAAFKHSVGQGAYAIASCSGSVP